MSYTHISNYQTNHNPVNLNKIKIASDGQKIVPVIYNMKDSKFYSRYGWYIVDSLRSGEKPIRHNPDGIGYIRWGQFINKYNCLCRKLYEVEYYYNDKLHNENGPAYIQEDDKRYFNNGLLHRFNGPAVDNKWYFFNKLIPENIVKFNNGIPSKPLDKISILEATFDFDRNYGKILNVIYSTNNILSEKEVRYIVKGKL